MSEEIDKALADQKRGFTLMEQISGATKTETAKSFSASDVEARLALLEVYWQRFSDNDYFLTRHAESLTGRTYFKSNVFNQALTVYLSAKSWLTERSRVLRSTAVSSAAVAHVQPAPVGAHQSALEKLKLPRFGGRQRDWEAFKERFESLVLNETTMSPVIKFQHLLNCLEGEAAAKLKGIQIVAVNFLTAWDTLCRRYDNKFLRFTVQMQALSSLPSASKETVSHLNQLLNTTNESINTFRALERPVQHWDDILIYFIESKLAAQTRMDWVKEVENKRAEEFPKYSELQKFLEDRIQTLDLVESEGDSSSRKPHSESVSKSVSASKPSRRIAASAISRTAAKPTQRQRCSFCGGEHFIGYCQKFASCSQNQRRDHANTARLCKNCLSSNHSVESCTSKGRCFVCGEKHHTRLHSEKSGVAANQSTASTSVNRSTSAHAFTESVKGFSVSDGKSVLLSTACVTLETDQGRAITVRALLDSGSEESFLSEHVVQALGLQSQPVDVVVSGVGNQTTVVAKKRVSVLLKSTKRPDFSLQFTALVLRRVTSLVPSTEVSVKQWAHLDGLTLADPHFGLPGRIDCILSSEVYAAIILQGIRRGERGSPVALQSVFGWVLMGAAQAHREDQGTRTASHHITVDQELSRAVTRFWETEEVPPSTTRLSPQEDACYQHFRSTHSRNSEGRFVVRLPFSEVPKLSNTYVISAACLTRLERRLAKQVELSTAYHTFMDEYLDLRHMEVVSDKEVWFSNICYLPHHPVIKKDGSGKIRVVFNASQRDSEGKSLNSHLYIGPKLQEDILIILIRWSFWRYVFTCDIVKMFRQFLVHQQDCNWQRILWRRRADSPVESFRLVTVTYGTTCAPFLANACMLQLAEDEHETFPKGAEVLQKGRYADDFFAGGDTMLDALDVRNQLVSILASAGMSVGKWAANQLELLSDVNLEDSKVKETVFREEETVSTLGIRWCPADDSFKFQIADVSSSEQLTKRAMLSEIARLFDPVGWLSPVIIKAKIMLQSLWMQGVDWDDPVSVELKQNWLNFRAQLMEVESIKIPRWYGTYSAVQWHLHCFCDASERAFAAALYLVVRSEGETRSTLIAAKSKVAPIKVISLPKLELCGAALLARLVSYLLPKLDIQPSKIFCWSDSKVVLAWLQGHPSKWKPFTANRVSEILRLLPNAVWKHVRSADNPADLATRGETPARLKDSALWWMGPSWLLKKEAEWPCVADEYSTSVEARKHDRCQGFVAQEQEIFSLRFSKYSSFDKIVRILSYICRWRSNSRLPKEQQRKDWFSASELALGKRSLLKIIQREAFREDIESLSVKGILLTSSPLRRLLPFIDQDGLLRVGGRLQNSYLSESEKHPIILPSKHPITAILIWKAHLATLHGGPTLVQSHLSRQFWILRARNFIRGIIRKCIKCARRNAVPQQQLMGPLPAVRTRPARPFTFTGVDYAGPFLIRASQGRGQKSFKGYVAIFVCMVVKAVHLEIVSDYTSAAFIAAFKRFVARRGLCKVLFSDNGTTFQGADAELQRLFAATSSMSQEIAAEIAKDGVSWTYIPPRAPNFGGLWEANVKGFKRHFQRVIGEAKLTFEEFYTLASQIEACLNSRPLSPLSSCAQDVAALTPGHFLIGAPLVSQPEPFVEINEPNSICSRWHLLSLMRNHFWKRWKHEFLAQTQERTKWLQPNYTLKVGDLVLFKDNLMPPAKWPLARIVCLHPGRDGLSRVATIRTAASEFKRSVNKLIVLPLNDNAETDLREMTVVTTGSTSDVPTTSACDPVTEKKM